MSRLPFQDREVKLGPNKRVRFETVTESEHVWVRIQVLYRDKTEWIIRGARMVSGDELSTLYQRMADVKEQFSVLKKSTKRVLRQQGTGGADKVHTGAKVLQAEAQQLQKMFDRELEKFNAQMRQAAKELLEIAQ